jgi:hypothetical protein
MPSGATKAQVGFLITVENEGSSGVTLDLSDCTLEIDGDSIFPRPPTESISVPPGQSDGANVTFAVPQEQANDAGFISLIIMVPDLGRVELRFTGSEIGAR